MVHVGAGDHQDRLTLRRNDLCKRSAQLLQRGQPHRAHGNRDKAKFPRQALQERQLHFERMLTAVRHGVLAQQREGALQLGSQGAINPHFAERRLPGALGEDSQRLALRVVPRAEDDVASWEFQPAVHGDGHVARILVTSVRHQASPSA